MNTDIVVTFERIGRTHNPPELRIPLAEIEIPESDHEAMWPGDRTNWTAVSEDIYDLARPLLKSAEADVRIYFKGNAIVGSILVDRFRDGGSFTITHPEWVVS